MIKNFITIAYRNFMRNKLFSLINLAGLSFGIACCILIFNFVTHELSYESSHAKADNLYRMLTIGTQGDKTEKLSVTANILGPIMKREYPEVLNFARYIELGGFRPVIVQYGDKIFNETKFAMGDSSMLDLFTFQFVNGEARNSLKNPMTCIITQSTAEKYFGQDYPIGKTIKVDNRWDVSVDAVIEDLPSNTTLDFNVLMSFHSLKNNTQEAWFPMNYNTYVELVDGANIADITVKLNEYVAGQFKQMFGEAAPFKAHFEFQPLAQIYLQQGIRADLGRRSDLSSIYAFAVIGLFILLIACINYINLTTAKSEKRAREVGIRKVMGALKKQLVFQFYGETFIMTFLAAILAIGLAELFLPYFNGLADKQLSLDIYSVRALGVLILGVLIIALVSGSYPAMYLSSFAPATVLKGSFKSGKSGDRFRKILVTAQFFIAAVLIVGVLVIFQQLQYASEKKLGFDSEEVLVIDVIGKEATDNSEILKSRVEQLAGVSSVSLASEVVGAVRAGYGCVAEGMEPNESVNCFGFLSDPDLFATLNLQLIAGTGYRDQAEGDTIVQFVINETMVKQIGWSPEEAIGKSFDSGFGDGGRVVGVVEDFHFNSLKTDIEPIALWVGDQHYRVMYIKANMSNSKALMARITEEWRQLNPNSPLEMSFLDDELNSLYENEERTANILMLFTLLSIAIGCLGLFGLTTFVVEKRTKEIGIRKVLGASEMLLIRLLSWDFLKLVLIANVLAFPLAWYGMNQWLANFAYHIAIGWEIFLVTGLVGMFISLSTVIFHALRTARSNPTSSLRNE